MQQQLQPLLTPEQVSETLQIPINTLKQWRFQKKGPRYFKLGKAVRYSFTDIADYIAANENLNKGN